jgi:hypothetical protein
MDSAKVQFEKLSPTAQNIVELVFMHGGDMRHMDIVSRLPADTTRADLMAAFNECRQSHLIWDKEPTPFNQVHTWNISPAFKGELLAAIKG